MKPKSSGRQIATLAFGVGYLAGAGATYIKGTKLSNQANEAVSFPLIHTILSPYTSLLTVGIIYPFEGDDSMSINHKKDGLDKPTGKTMRSFLGNLSTRILFVAPGALALLIASIWAWLAQKIYGKIPTTPNLLVGILFVFLMGSGGIGVILRSEFPTMTFVSIKGRPAYILGAIWLCFWWALGIGGIWKLIKIVFGA